MDNPVTEFFQMQENSCVNGDSLCGISSYISCIKINGRPILPPLITEEKKKELYKYKKKALEIESRLTESKQRSAMFIKSSNISTSENSLTDVSPNKQSTPCRPVTLELLPNNPSGTFILSSISDSKTSKPMDQDQAKLRQELENNNDKISSQRSTKKMSKSYKNTLESRLAMGDVSLPNKKNLYEQSPIIEENYQGLVSESVDSDDSKNEKRRWSPLNIDSINSLRVETVSREPHAAENSFVSLRDLDSSSGTITASPNLMRQNSYTLLTPSPALLNYLETQKDGEQARRSQSGRKTWDLTKAKKNWDPAAVENSTKHEALNNRRENSSSLESFPSYKTSDLRNPSPNRNVNSCTDDGSTSPSSYSFKTNSPRFQKIKCKIKNKRGKPHKNVPSPKPTDHQVPKSGSKQGVESVVVPFQVKEELNDLTKLLLRMKMEHEREKNELEERQKSEMRELEMLFKRRESELLQRVGQETPVCPRSIYSHYSDSAEPNKFHVQMMGDGKHNSVGDNIGEPERRPQSAKDYYSSCTDQGSRRTRSMDFNQGVPNQDTDVDISLQDSFQSKELYPGMEDVIDTDTISNCSTHSSTMSSDSKLESMPLLDIKKFKTFEVSPEEFEKYNQEMDNCGDYAPEWVYTEYLKTLKKDYVGEVAPAKLAAAVITAAARGFLTRRLLRTAHVQALITTLRDAISCATQLHGASDLGESDVDLMKRLGRQIEAAWEAVYSVFFDTDPSARMQLISADRERLRSVSAKLTPSEPKKRISSATLKSLRRKSGSELFMSKSQIANGSNSERRVRSRMVASYPSPGQQYKLK